MDKSSNIEVMASQWLIRSDSDHWSAVDQAELTQWLQGSTAHMVAYLRAQSMWQEAGRLKALGAGVVPGMVPAPGEIQRSPYFDKPYADKQYVDGDLPRAPIDEKHPRPRFSYWPAAAALLVIGAAVAWWQGFLAQTQYSTPIGVMSSVPLSDGSKVMLNTGSDIRLAMSETERRVDLERGEAFFDVARDSRRPFVVVVGDRRIVAVGTQFSVRRNGHDVQVVVTEGEVRVEQAQLTAGSIARADGAGVHVEQRPMTELEEILSWRSGYVIFRETPLIDAAAEFNRYNNRRIVIQDPALSAIRIGGKFRSTNIESFIQLLEDGFSVRVEERGDSVVLTAPGRM